jgi:hypothetical protein
MFKVGDKVRAKGTSRTGEVIEILYVVEMGPDSCWTYKEDALEAYTPPSTEEVWAVVGAFMHHEVESFTLPLSENEKTYIISRVHSLLHSHNVSLDAKGREHVRRILKAVITQVDQEQRQ